MAIDCSYQERIPAVRDARRLGRGVSAPAGPELFFPARAGSGRDTRRVCLACAGHAECLEYALTTDERFGIWGGLSRDRHLPLR